MSGTTTPQRAGNDEWTQAADKAKEAAANMNDMATHAASAAGQVASQAACDMGQRVDEMTATCGSNIRDLGERMHREAPQGGFLGGASQAFAQSIQNSGDYIEHARLSGMTDDLAQLIRRNPLSAIAIAMGIGWFVGRKLGT